MKEYGVIYTLMRRHIQERAFTLLELSISLVIASLVLAMVLTVENHKLRHDKMAETQQKLDTIEKAVYNYRVENNKLLCPSNAKLAVTDNNFGVALNALGACENDTNIFKISIPSTPADQVVAGDVPVRSLGLADDMAFDGWGRKFRYAVDQDVSFTANAQTTESAVTSGNLIVMDESNTTISAGEIFMVIASFGPNGHGGYTSNGTVLNAGSVNGNEQANCFCTSAGTYAVPAQAIFYQARFSQNSTNALNSFDDIVRYFPRNFFYTQAEKYP